MCEIFPIPFVCVSISGLASAFIQYQLLLDGNKKYSNIFLFSFFFLWKKGPNVICICRGKFSLNMWMENGKFYYVRLSAFVWVCALFYSFFSFFFSLRFRYVCDCRYRLKCIQNYYLHFRKYCVCIRTYCHPFYFSNVWWLTHCYCCCSYCYRYVVRVCILVMVIQQLISDSSMHILDERTTERQSKIHRKWMEWWIEWEKGRKNRMRYVHIHVWFNRVVSDSKSKWCIQRTHYIVYTQITHSHTHTRNTPERMSMRLQNSALWIVLNLSFVRTLSALATDKTGKMVCACAVWILFKKENEKEIAQH